MGTLLGVLPEIIVEWLHILKDHIVHLEQKRLHSQVIGPTLPRGNNVHKLVGEATKMRASSAHFRT